MKKLVSIYLTAIISICLFQCSSKLEKEEKGHGVFHTIAEYEGDSAKIAARSTDYLEAMELIKVQLKDTSLSNFYIQNSSIRITSFPCQNCHSKSLETLQANRPPNKRKSHWDIQINHASDKTMQCSTCHNQESFDELISLTGKSISLNHSYQLCAQCHSTQHKDWEIGAHGKRLGGWVKPRVINNCVSCHNPHKPAFESRFPARLNTQHKE